MQQHSGRIGPASDVEIQFLPGVACPAVMLGISEPESSNSRWRLDVYAQSSEGGAHRLGALVTPEPVLRVGLVRPGGARWLLSGFCPGAVAWSARVRKLSGDSGHGASFSWGEAPLGTAPGLTPLWGDLELSGLRWTVGSAVVASPNVGQVVVPAGGQVERIIAYQTGADSYLEIQAPTGAPAIPVPTIQLPPDGSVALTPGRRLLGPATVVLGLDASPLGTMGYLCVEYLY